MAVATLRSLQENARRRAIVLGAAAAAAAPGVSFGQAALQPVTLSLPGPGNSVSIPLELAVRIGADRAEGLELRLRFVGGGGVAIQELLTGNAAFAVFGLPAAMNSNLSQSRIVALAAIDDLPLYTLMVRADLRGKVTRIEDLKGRVLGIHSNSLSTRTTSHQLAELLIRSRGLKPDDVRYVAAGQSWETQSAAFISKSVDASMCDEPFGTRLAEENLAFPLFGTGNPEDARQLPGAGFLRATLFGRRDRVDAQPALAERMVKVVLRALAWIAARGPEQIADTLGMTGLDRKSFVDAYRKYPRQYSRDGRFSRAQLQDTEVFFRATTPDNPAAAALSLSSMIVDRWAASKP